ncbi:hypothetical protein ACFV3F_41500 [Streptomyces sp. NPDC059717]|uniref:hypothetical protein n=1 Tax=Streptomyces sp. NPDC059717 TaxID=3346922 RepID=UPI00367CCE0E
MNQARKRKSPTPTCRPMNLRRTDASSSRKETATRATNRAVANTITASAMVTRVTRL